MYKTFATLIIILAASASCALAADTSDATSPLFPPYEEARQALLHDTLDGVEQAAATIVKESRALADSSDKPKHRELLTTISGLAERLTTTESLEQTREGFAELSRAMVRYRDTATGSRPMVVYCSMAKKPWLQPDGEIGNPYYGQAMARCGDVISRDG